jgi:ubiquinone/menaquinone biosynthesis C-methylase UbiE
MDYLDPINLDAPDAISFYDELPVWSAYFACPLLETLPVAANATVLDVGAGTGFLTLEIAQRCGTGARVLAVDPWAAASERLRQKIAYLNLSNVRVMTGDAATLDLANGSVDLVVCNLGINNFERPAEVLKECFRVSKPGAQLFLTTNVTGHMKEFYDVLRYTLESLQQHHRLPILEDHIARRGTPKTTTALLQDAGFRIDRQNLDTFSMCFANGSALLRHYFIRLGFVPGWKAIPDAHSLHETFFTLERNLNEAAAVHGTLRLTIPRLQMLALKPAQVG